MRVFPRLAAAALLLLLSVVTAHAQSAGWVYPTSTAYSAGAGDNGKVLASDNVTAGSISVTLPDPASVGAGWMMGFSEGNGRGITVTPPVNTYILAGQKSLTALSSPGDTNFEYYALSSDGSNFRLLSATSATSLQAGLIPTPAGSTWALLYSTGYSATAADNAHILSSAYTGGPTTITLPSAPLLPNGWAISVYADANETTLQPNAVQGGVLVNAGGQAVDTLKVGMGGFVTLSFDGAAFRAINYYTPATTGKLPLSQFNVIADGVTDQKTKIQAAIDAAHALGLTVICDVKGSIASSGDMLIYGSPDKSLGGDQFEGTPGCKFVPTSGYSAARMFGNVDAPGHLYSQDENFNAKFVNVNIDLNNSHGSGIMFDSCIGCLSYFNRVFGISNGTFTFFDGTMRKTGTVGGTITNGNVISVRLQSTIGGFDETVTYAASLTDTPASIAAGIANAIFNNANLPGVAVGAAASPADPARSILASNVVNIYYPDTYADISITYTQGSNTETIAFADAATTFPDSGMIAKGTQKGGLGGYYTQFIGGGMAPYTCNQGSSSTGVGMWFGSSGSVARPNAPYILGPDLVNASGQPCGFKIAIDFDSVGDGIIDGPTDVTFSDVGVQLGGTGKLVTKMEIRHLYMEQPGTCGINRTSDSSGTLITLPQYTLGPGKPICGRTFGRTFIIPSGSLSVSMTDGIPEGVPIRSSNNTFTVIPGDGSITIGSQTTGIPGYMQLLGLGTASEFTVDRFNSLVTPYSWASLTAVGNGFQNGFIGTAAAFNATQTYAGSGLAGFTTEAQTSTTGGQSVALLSTLNGASAKSQRLVSTSTGGLATCGDVSSNGCAPDPGLGGLSLEGQGLVSNFNLFQANYTYALGSAFTGAVGSGYVVGNTITLTGGTCGTPIVITVENVSPTGALQEIPAQGVVPGRAGWHISTTGSCTVRGGTLTQASTSGTGSGATFTPQAWSALTKTALGNGQTIGNVNFMGNKNDADYIAASISATPAEAFDSSHGGVTVTFKSTIAGGIDLEPRLQFNSDGSITTCNGGGTCAAAAGNGNLGVKGGIFLTPMAAPSSPASGWAIYVDSGDLNKLKAKASTGTVATLGVP